MTEIAVERESEVPASVETVWRRITDPTLISDWMEGEVELEPKPGGRIVFRPTDGAGVWGTVEEVIDQKRIQWSWRTDDGLPSLVEIELKPGSVDGHTLIKVRETLLPWRVSGPDGYTEWPELSRRSDLVGSAT